MVTVAHFEKLTKHKCVKKITQVEIDHTRYTTFGQQYFPQLCDANTDPRVTFDVSMMLLNWVKNAEDQSIDLSSS